MTRDFNSGIIHCVSREDAELKLYTDWNSVRIHAAIKFASDLITSKADTNGVPPAELAVKLADNIVELLKMKGEEHPSEDNAHSRKNRKPFDAEWTSKFERIKPAVEFKFREGELVEPISNPGRGFEILSRKYITNEKTAYFCKYIGWMTEGELQKYDPNNSKQL